MDRLSIEKNTRIIPEASSPRIFSQHLKSYEYIKDKVKDRFILEIGFGEGYGSVYLAKVAKKVIGIDYDEEAVFSASLKYNLDNLSFLCMEASKLGFKNNTFDIICSFQVIEHIQEEKVMLYLQEVYRILKLGGEFYLSTPNINVNRKGNVDYKRNPAHHKELTQEEIRDLLYNVFQDVDILGIHANLKHIIFLRLKKIGLDKMLPKSLNPIRAFFNNITTNDFIVTDRHLDKAQDFICRCRKI